MIDIGFFLKRLDFQLLVEPIVYSLLGLLSGFMHVDKAWFLYINYRHSYNKENAQLSRAQRHSRKGDLFVPVNARSYREEIKLDWTCQCGFA